MVLPKHWRSLSLANLVIGQKGKRPLVLSKRRFPEAVPYLSIEAVEKDIISFYAEPYSTVLASEKNILIVADGSRSGLVIMGKKGAVGSTLISLTPLGIEKDFLFYALRARYEYLNKNTKGSSIPHLNLKLFYDMQIAVPPPKEQKLISKFLQEQLTIYSTKFADVERELLETDNYRKSLLREAITGGLIATNNKKQVNRGFKIPSHWEWKTLEEVCDYITDGEHQSIVKMKSGVSFVDIGDIRNGHIGRSSKFVSLDYYKALPEYKKPRQDDVLFSVVGSIGNCAIVTTNSKFYFQRNLALLRAGKLILPEILYYFLCSDFIQGQAKSKAKGDGQQLLNLASLRNIKIPLPPIKDQKKIISLLRSLLTKAEDDEVKHHKTKDDLEKLQQALVQTAITGKALKINDKDNTWLEDFLVIIEKDRAQFKADIAKRRSEVSSKTKRIQAMKNTQSIVKILKDAPKKTLPIEELWQQSVYRESQNIEGFYEELVQLISPKKGKAIIAFEFIDEKKIYGNVKLLRHAA